MLPSSSANLGVFFAYPQGFSSADLTSYWLAASGHKVRMTPVCKTALLATFEAVIERAVVPVGVGNSLNGDLKQADFGTGQNSRKCLISLGDWGLASKRSNFKDELIRGCPKQEWDLFIENVWKLWKTVGAQISYSSNSFYFYGWQIKELDEGFDDWQDVTEEVDLNFNVDLNTTPADETSDYAEHDYAPWGNYMGPDYSQINVSSATQFLIDAIEHYGGSVNVGTPSFPTSIAGHMQSISPSQPLGLIEDGHLGNWTDGTNSTSERRSSTGWAVFQTMLANMRYTHISFDYTIDFMHLHVKRTYTRRWVYDDYDMVFSLEDVGPQDPDYTDDVVDNYTYTNYLESGCDSGSMDGSLLVGLKFIFLKGAQGAVDLVLNSYPAQSEGLVKFNAKDYTPEFTGTGGDGLVKMYEEKRGPEYVDAVYCSLTDAYPATQFGSYATSGSVHFVDYKNNNDSSQGWIKVSKETGSSAGTNSLHTAIFGHGQDLMSAIPTPTSFEEPDEIDTGAISDLNQAFWGNWYFLYPETPNYNGGTQFFPTHIITPSGLRHPIEEESDRYVCRSGDAFGNFDEAFPDFGGIYPSFSWFATTYGKAIMSHTWSFKALG